MQNIVEETREEKHVIEFFRGVLVGGGCMFKC